MATTFGEAWLPTVRAKLLALMQELMLDMQTQDISPRLGYAYDTHYTPDILLYSVSIEHVGTSEVDIASGVPLMITNYPSFTLRVHTDYAGGDYDALVAEQLITSVVNKLRVNYDLEDCNRVWAIVDITGIQEFADSATIGAQCTVQIKSTVLYTQES